MSNEQHYCSIPTTEELKQLAVAYLRQQRLHWPGSTISVLREEEIATEASEMASSYVKRLGTSPTVGAIPTPASARGVAACYLRRPCHCEGTFTLERQLTAVLAAAKSAGHFISWDCLFADCDSPRSESRPLVLISIGSKVPVESRDDMIQLYIELQRASGMLFDDGWPRPVRIRFGYHLMEQAMGHTGAWSPGTLYVYDLSRLSRDSNEVQSFAAMLRALGKALVSASDALTVD